MNISTLSNIFPKKEFEKKYESLFDQVNSFFTELVYTAVIADDAKKFTSALLMQLNFSFDCKPSLLAELKWSALPARENPVFTTEGIKDGEMATFKLDGILKHNVLFLCEKIGRKDGDQKLIETNCSKLGKAMNRGYHL